MVYALTKPKLSRTVILMKVRTDALRGARISRELTQQALANKVGLSRAGIQWIERGESTRLTTIRTLAKALGVAVADLAVAEDDTDTQALALEEAS